MVGFGQVTDLTNIKKERKKTPVAYDTSYFQVSYSTTEEMKMGLIGQEITVIETNYLYVLDTESKKNISYSDEDKIEGKVFTIEDYIVDGYKEYYLINNGSCIQDPASWIQDLASLHRICSWSMLRP